MPTILLCDLRRITLNKVAADIEASLSPKLVECKFQNLCCSRSEKKFEILARNLRLQLILTTMT